MKKQSLVKEVVFDPDRSPVDPDGEKVREVIGILDQDRGGSFNGRAACAQMILKDLLFWFSFDPGEHEGD